jgi:hypothetical protein
MTWNPLRSPRTCRPARRPVRRSRPAVEPLEGRLTPSTNVLSYHNDNLNDGHNGSETALTPTNVNTATFGKLFSAGVDGQVYAQPLYLANVNITTGTHQGVHNVVFLATEHDSLFAFDADNGTLLWQDALLNPVDGGTVTSVPSSDVGAQDLSPEIGVTSTPVIDPTTNVIYVEAKTKEVATDGAHYVHQLYAINVADGSYAAGGPALIADSLGDTYVNGPTVNGTGSGSNNGIVYFDSLRQLNRPGLTEANGNIYLAYASHGDNPPYHGWILSYNASTLQLNAVFNATPNGSDGGIWQGGSRLDAGGGGNLFFETGNGTFDGFDNNGQTGGLNAQGFPINGDYGDSFVKIGLDPSTNRNHQNINGWGLKVLDYFTPFDQDNLNNGDLDLGSGGPVLLPASVGSTAHPSLLVGSGKEGRIYLIDRNNMGKFDIHTDHVVQETSNTAISGSFGAPAYYNGSIYYVGGSNIGNPDDNAKTFSIANAQLSFGPTSRSPDTFGYPGSTPSITSNGLGKGIAWDLDTGTNELRAYRANGYNTELYTSNQDANRDALDGSVIKFAVPTVVNGKVYVGTSTSLDVYGLLGTRVTQPPADPPGDPGDSGPQPAAPTAFTATPASGTEIDLSWPGSATPTLFALDRATRSDFSDAVTLTSGTRATTWVDGALTPGSTFYYRLRAVDGAGGSRILGTVSATTPTLPAGVSDLQVSGVTAHEVDLSWTNNATNADRIEVFRQKNANNFILIAELPPTATSLRDTGLVMALTPGAHYTYDVQALNLAGPSPVAGVTVILPRGTSSPAVAAAARPSRVSLAGAATPAPVSSARREARSASPVPSFGLLPIASPAVVGGHGGSPAAEPVGTGTGTPAAAPAAGHGPSLVGRSPTDVALAGDPDRPAADRDFLSAGADLTSL